MGSEGRNASLELPTVGPPAELFRIHRAEASGLDLPPWQFARAVAPDGGFNFGGRWDDPKPIEGERFRTLSLGNDRIGVALEVFQSLRPDPILASLEASLRDPNGPPRGPRPTINVSDLTSRRMSVIELDPDARFVDVTNSKVRAYLEEQLSPSLTQNGIGTLKIGDLLGKDTQLSQRVAELVHDRFPHVAGLISPSTLGTDFTNYYVFEAQPESGQLRADGRVLESRILSSRDPEVRIALDELRVDLALDADPALTVAPQPLAFRMPSAPPGRDTDRNARGAPGQSEMTQSSGLPVYAPGPNEIVDRRESRAAADQTMRILGISDAGDIIFGRAGGAVVSVPRAAFGELPKVDDMVTVREIDGQDRAQSAGRDVALER